MEKIKFCEKHNICKKYDSKFRKYTCKLCKNEYAAIYREKNQETIKIKLKKYNIRTRERRQEWIRKDRLENPDKYKKYAKKTYDINREEFYLKKKARKYKLSVQELKLMLEKCNHHCEMCGKAEKRKTGRGERLTNLSIDHDHETNKIRGILCFKCNIGIGFFEEDIDLLQKAIDYLKKHKCK